MRQPNTTIKAPTGCIAAIWCVWISVCAFIHLQGRGCTFSRRLLVRRKSSASPPLNFRSVDRSGLMFDRVTITTCWLWRCYSNAYYDICDSLQLSKFRSFDCHNYRILRSNSATFGHGRVLFPYSIISDIICTRPVNSFVCRQSV